MTDMTEFVAGASSEAAPAALAADLLGHWWSRPVREEVETWLAYADLARDVFDGPAFPLPFASIDDRALRELLDEHERLFVGPGPVPCPPFESCWHRDVPFDRQRSLMGPCVAEMRELYGRLGLELAHAGVEYGDYLPVELEALAVALTRLDGVEVSRSILADHVLRWVPPFAESVLRETHHPFYRDLARVTLAWAAAEAAAETAAASATAAAAAVG